MELQHVWPLSVLCRYVVLMKNSGCSKESKIRNTHLDDRIQTGPNTHQTKAQLEGIYKTSGYKSGKTLPIALLVQHTF